jgi:hypothetical protein
VTEKKTKLSRRNFLLTVGAGGVATAAAVVRGKASGPVPDKSDKRATSGYKVSEHINNYYRTTKV